MSASEKRDPFKGLPTGGELGARPRDDDIDEALARRSDEELLRELERRERATDDE